MEVTGRFLIVLGVVIALVGLWLTLGDRLPFRPGRLPLDFRYERDNVSFYFPLGTSILISVILSVIFMLFSRR